jgi:hypothetical protein
MIGINSWNDAYCELFQTILVIWAALVSGLSLGITTVAYMYKFYIRKYDDIGENSDSDLESGTSSEEEEEESDAGAELQKAEELKLYKELYYDELNALADRDLKDVPWAKLVLKEMTPQNLVIMLYDPVTERFCYYADEYQKISYAVLDTLARKFAVQFDCKRICVNYKEELGLAKTAAAAAVLKDEKEKEAAEPVVKSVFASFKKYNNNHTNHSNNTFVKPNDLKKALKKVLKAQEKEKEKAEEEEEEEENYILPENANRFKYKGKIREYYQEPLTPVVPIKKVVDYATFKLMKEQEHLKTE